MLREIRNFGPGAALLALATALGSGCTSHHDSGTAAEPDSGHASPKTETQVEPEAAQSGTPAEPQGTESQAATPAAAAAQQPAPQSTPATATTPAASSYQNPPAVMLDDPTNLKLYNYLKEPITSVNGRALPEPLPPGKVAAIPKLYQDLNLLGDTYDLSIATQSGRRADATFDSGDVDGAGWSATVNDGGGQPQIAQSAFGSGGGKDLQNFR
jgi:hypothetical protein